MFEHPLLKNIAYDWRHNCREIWESDEFHRLLDYIDLQYSRFEMYPPDKHNIFKAFEVPMRDIKVVIVGQEPYAKPFATGRSFESGQRKIVPPQLKNILKEVKRDLKVDFKDSGDLTPWAKQGVMLLHKTLMVRRNMPKLYWKRYYSFFEKVITVLMENKSNLVFMLWGKSARFMALHVDASRHLILNTSSPSPLSARLGFNGCSHFSQCNKYLGEHLGRGIDWTL